MKKRVEMVAEMQDAVGEVHGDLTELEVDNLGWALAILGRVNVSLAPKVVTFFRPDLLGLYKGGEIFIARKVLLDRHETLGTLIHEHSHGWGGDGSLDHSQKIEEMWVSVARKMM